MLLCGACHTKYYSATHETSSTWRKISHGMQTTMELQYSCWIVATDETSSTLRRATYGMQNALELRHLCLIVAKHEASSTMPAATGITCQHPEISPCHESDTPTSPNAVPATTSDSPTLGNVALAPKSDIATHLAFFEHERACIRCVSSLRTGHANS